MESIINAALQEKDYLILDGGLATTLELDGHVLDREMWSAYTAAQSPLSVVSVHERFYAAGSDIVTTSSYQMSYEGFAKKGLCHNPADLLDPANRLFRSSTAYAIAARESLPPGRRRHAYVATSVGCYGAHKGDGSEYTGEYTCTRHAIQQWHAQKLDIQLDSGADLVAFETIPCVDECHALCSLVAKRDEQALVNGWMSFACKSGGLLNSGECLEDALRVVLDQPLTSQCKRYVCEHEHAPTCHSAHCTL